MPIARSKTHKVILPTPISVSIDINPVRPYNQNGRRDIVMSLLDRLLGAYLMYRIAGFIGCAALLPILCFLPTYGTVLVLCGMGGIILLWAVYAVVILVIDLIRYGL